MAASAAVLLNATAPASASLDTSWLLRFRHSVIRGRISRCDDCDGHLAALDAILPACRGARKAYAALPSSAALEDAIVPMMLVWSSLSTLRHSHPLYLPPIYYGSDAPRALLHELVAKVRRRETSDEKHDTDHAVIGGIEGTGKSTVVKALALGVAACSESYFLAYADVAVSDPIDSSWLGDIHAEIAARHACAYFDGEFGTLRSATGGEHARVFDAARGGKALSFLRNPPPAFRLADGSTLAPMRLGVIVDEVQRLFVEHAEQSDPRVVALRHLEAFAKHSPGALLVLTGTSANLRRRLFAKARCVEFKNYGDFNRSLSSYYEVPALRTLRELREYLRIRYSSKAREFDDGDVARILHDTGGIGRLVHARVTSNTSLSELSRRRLRTPAEAMTDPGGGIARLAIEVRSSQGERGALVCAGMAWDAAALLPTDVSLPYEAARLHLLHCGLADSVSAAVRLVEDWVDSGLAYVVYSAQLEPLAVQLARPADATIYLEGAPSRLECAKLTKYSLLTA